MNYDPTGHFVITLSAFFISVGIGAGIGAGITFGKTLYNDYADDGQIFNESVSSDEYFGNTLGGLVAGAGVGVCSVLGGGLGASMIAGEAFSVGGMTLSGFSAFGLGTSTAFATGMAGYSLSTVINKNETFRVTDMLIEGGANAISGTLSFVGGMGGGITGTHIPGIKKGLINSLKYHGGLTYFGVYPLKVIVTKIRSLIEENAQ